jgi:hypothetical protein
MCQIYVNLADISPFLRELGMRARRHEHGSDQSGAAEAAHGVLPKLRVFKSRERLC